MKKILELEDGALFANSEGVIYYLTNEDQEKHDRGLPKHKQISAKKAETTLKVVKVAKIAAITEA
jgi:hypothetical protein